MQKRSGVNQKISADFVHKIVVVSSMWLVSVEVAEGVSPVVPLTRERVVDPCGQVDAVRMRNHAVTKTVVQPLLVQKQPSVTLFSVMKLSLQKKRCAARCASGEAVLAQVQVVAPLTCLTTGSAA
eukprot:5385974-Amphidinium_carterae.6